VTDAERVAISTTPGDQVNELAYSVQNLCVARGSVIDHLEGLERRG